MARSGAASRTGASSGVEVIGLKEFRRGLKAVGAEWPKELRRVHKTIADRGAALAQGFASGMGGVQAKAAGAIRGRANQRSARIGVAGGRGSPMANVAFWGAKRHSGWYAAARYSDSPPQHPPWVGNSWEPAVFGQGPYAINPALARYLPELLDEYGQMIDRLAADAFPDGSRSVSTSTS